MVTDEPEGMEYGRQDYVEVRQPLQVSVTTWDTVENGQDKWSDLCSNWISV